MVKSSGVLTTRRWPEETAYGKNMITLGKIIHPYICVYMHADIYLYIS